MFIGTQEMLVSQDQVVLALARIRQEWELAAQGESLIQVEASVGLLLADLVTALGFPPVERVQVLGQRLVDDLQDVLLLA